MILKADGPAVRILWSIDCNEACVTAAVRTEERQTDMDILTLATRIISALQNSELDIQIQ